MDVDVRLQFEGLLYAHRRDEAGFRALLDSMSKEDVYRVCWDYGLALEREMGWSAEQLQSYDADGDEPESGDGLGT